MILQMTRSEKAGLVIVLITFGLLGGLLWVDFQIIYRGATNLRSVFLVLQVLLWVAGIISGIITLRG